MQEGLPLGHQGEGEAPGARALPASRESCHWITRARARLLEGTGISSCKSSRLEGGVGAQGLFLARAPGSQGAAAPGHGGLFPAPAAVQVSVTQS